jgi:hypothetical protein
MNTNRVPVPVPLHKLVLVPALITLAFSLLRLIGEMRGWSSTLFSTDPGGPGSVIGIVWLVPIFGFWFGWRLAAAGHAPKRPGLAEMWHLLGIALIVAVGVCLTLLELKLPRSLVPAAIANVIILVLPLRAWPSLFQVNLLYGLLARLPVIVITFFAVPRKLGTHYEKLGDQNLQMDPLPKALWLSLAQIGFWVPFTILFGGLFGCVAARWVRGRDRRRAAAASSRATATSSSS